MPLLGDYLGHLLSEITLARVQADLEAVRVADLYASHPLLKSMAVPRFRMPTITLDVPVSVVKMEEAQPGEAPRGSVATSALRERFGTLLSRHLASARLELSANDKTRLDQALDRSIAIAAVPSYVAASSAHLADELVSTVLGVLATRETSSEARSRLDTFANELTAAARLEFLQLRTEPPRLHVLVTSAELREAGPPEFLARLHLAISEEACEWSMTEAAGRTSSKLVPE